jgi:hypothetical protein
MQEHITCDLNHINVIVMTPYTHPLQCCNTISRTEMIMCLKLKLHCNWNCIDDETVLMMGNRNCIATHVNSTHFWFGSGNQSHDSALMMAWINCTFFDPAHPTPVTDTIPHLWLTESKRDNAWLSVIIAL